MICDSNMSHAKYIIIIIYLILFFKSLEKIKLLVLFSGNLLYNLYPSFIIGSTRLSITGTTLLLVSLKKMLRHKYYKYLEYYDKAYLPISTEAQLFLGTYFQRTPGPLHILLSNITDLCAVLNKYW